MPRSELVSQSVSQWVSDRGRQWSDSSLLNGSQLVSQSVSELLTSITNDQTWVRKNCGINVLLWSFLSWSPDGFHFWTAVFLSTLVALIQIEVRLRETTVVTTVATKVVQCTLLYPPFLCIYWKKTTWIEIFFFITKEDGSILLGLKSLVFESYGFLMDAPFIYWKIEKMHLDMKYTFAYQ